MKSLLPIKAAFLTILILGGCIATSLPTLRTETAQRIAAPAWMIKRDIPAAPYLLRAYERIHKRGGIANIYIEGDGINGKYASGKRADFTPVNPVALHLASKDNAENLIYLARPCQFTGRIAYPHKCENMEWQEERFSQDVINTYNNALDEIRNRYNIRGFHITGYSGGAAIATILAAQRKDILSLRTVAGIMDNQAYTAMNNNFPLSSNALNPVNYASDLVKIPQYHFTGGQDHLVHASILNSYLQALPPTHCVQTLLVQEAEHEAGWVDKWPEILKLPVTCTRGNAALIEPLIEPEYKPSAAEKLRAFDKKTGKTKAAKP